MDAEDAANASVANVHEVRGAVNGRAQDVDAGSGVGVREMEGVRLHTCDGTIAVLRQTRDWAYSPQLVLRLVSSSLSLSLSQSCVLLLMLVSIPTAVI